MGQVEESLCRRAGVGGQYLLGFPAVQGHLAQHFQEKGRLVAAVLRFWAQAAWQVLQLTGQRLVKDGKALEAEADNLAELTRQAQEFAEKRIPVFRALQVV